MSRLASFRGPSTPSATPVSSPGAPKNPRGGTNQVKGSPRRPSATTTSSRVQTSKRDADTTPAESPFHRKTRALLLELQGLAESWDNLVLLDGLRMLRTLVDTRTELDNELKLIGNNPRRRVVAPKILTMEKSLADLTSVIINLRKIFNKMTIISESFVGLLTEAHKAKGWRWCVEEPLWVSWPLERFVSNVPSVIRAYHRSLHSCEDMVASVSSHDVVFDEARAAISHWAAQEELAEYGWEGSVWGTGWTDLCEAEIEGWPPQ